MLLSGGRPTNGGEKVSWGRLTFFRGERKRGTKFVFRKREKKGGVVGEEEGVIPYFGGGRKRYGRVLKRGKIALIIYPEEEPREKKRVSSTLLARKKENHLFTGSGGVSREAGSTYNTLQDRGEEGKKRRRGGIFF